MVVRTLSIISIVFSGLIVTDFVGEVRADSCWDHNGSLMRLKASGNKRWLYYEIPREALRRTGVK